MILRLCRRRWGSSITPTSGTRHNLIKNKMSTFKRFCFTLNNYDETELESLRARLSKEARYAIFGKEVGKEGTPHLQGYVSVSKNLRLSSAKKLVGDRCHIEKAKGTEEQNFIYCSKGGLYEEFGRREIAGKRTDLEKFKESVKLGTLSVKELRDMHSDVFAKYPRFCLDYIGDHKPREKPECHPLREWQEDLFQELKKEPDDRTVKFYVDRVGNSGKTWFSKYYCYLFDNAYYMRPTKHADMAYALPETLRVLFLDCTRQQVEHLPYSFLEAVKDGMVFSSKYESRLKTYGRVHVVVFMNQPPNLTALSEDRYQINYI